MHNVEYCPWCGRVTSEKTKIIKVVETYGHMPHTWSAWTDEGEELHIKHIWGFVVMYSMETRDIIHSVKMSDDDSFNSLFSYNDLKNWTNRVFDWHEGCEDE